MAGFGHGDEGTMVYVVNSERTVTYDIAPDLIPGHLILAQLGRGGMGTVYQARQISLDRIVAVKLLSSELSEIPDFVRRFEREAKILATLRHPNLVVIHDRGVAQGRCYFTMEYVDGSTLDQVLGNGLLPISEALRIVLSMCDAIAYTHAQGVIHRDLKPGNVILSQDGTVKITDFGLVGLLGTRPPSDDLTKTNMAMGTVDYMAPEQRRNAKDVDERADVYALAVMLYELLTGTLPFGSFAPPSHHRPDPTCAKLDAICTKALAADPADRTRSVKELGTAIRGAVDRHLTTNVNQLSETVVPTPHKKEPSLKVRSSRRPRVLLVLVCLALGLGLIAFVRLHTLPPPTVEQAIAVQGGIHARIRVKIDHENEHEPLWQLTRVDRILRRRLELYGVTAVESDLVTLGSDSVPEHHILLRAAGSRALRPAVWTLLTLQNLLGFHLVHPNGESDDEQQLHARARDSGSTATVFPAVRSVGESEDSRWFLVESRPLLDGSSVATVGVKTDSFLGKSAIEITLTEDGSASFEQLTAQFVERRLAIILGGQVYFAPLIRERLVGPRLSISGDFDREEAEELAKVIVAGALPTAVEILEIKPFRVE